MDGSEDSIISEDEEAGRFFKSDRVDDS